VTKAYYMTLIKKLEKKVLVLFINILSCNDHTSMCESWGEGELLSVVLL
jgi:hypothetical protein